MKKIPNAAKANEANDRALGSGYLWAAQTWPQMITLFGPNGAAELLGLTNTLIVFGGGNNHDFNAQVADMIGVRQRTHRNYTGGGGRDSWSTTTQDVHAVCAEQIRAIPEHRALILTDRSRPTLADLHRCIDGPRGRRLMNDHRQRAVDATQRPEQSGRAEADARTYSAVAKARHLHLHLHLHAEAATDDGNDSR